MLKFELPDSGTLLRSGRLPERLRETALLCAAHPEGAEGYMSDLVQTAIVAGDRAEIVTRAISTGMELGHVLVAEMLVQPQVTPEEVADGCFHELDVRMLLEFAERRRNLDAAGNELPIVVLERWARFRDEQGGPRSAGDRGENGSEPGRDVPDPDRDEV